MNLVDLTWHVVTDSITAEGVANPLDWDIRFGLVFTVNSLNLNAGKGKGSGGV